MPDGPAEPRPIEPQTAPLEATRDGEVVKLSGRATDLEELGQVVTAAAAAPGVEEVDVDDVEVEQPDSGLWH